MGLCPSSEFKEADTRGKVTFERRTKDVLKRLNAVERFEYTFPFYRLRIDHYEGRIKRYVNLEDEDAVSLKQLQYSFMEDDPWADLSDTTSLLY